ncbi:senescence-associated carboxylesterase 101-like isoform X2 [Ziziphus jujuba]|uniref:Senescence-associated carboxylesterase 101-like isoform X2 n=1 Tax=Ziziphus jujuba TaxID=326968 RepID=A0A6P3ZKT9_ZIZJJ|nr:senescence-associated carboxylesterase 101-like isoform X2 [Ziziphus jujuba]
MTVFSNGSETANLVASSGLLQQLWTANWNLYGNNDPNERLRFQVYSQENYNILAFVTSPLTLQADQADLASLSTLKEKFPVFELLCSKNNPTFAINKATILLFASYHNILSELKNELCKGPPYKPLIITGHSLGGSIASLFTLWMLNSMDLSKTKRPLCITFGSPLIGDHCLHKAIFQSQTWKSCFLHVVTNQDPVPRILLHHKPAHQKGVYKPFGTFLICCESGSACFEDPDSILELLAATASHGAQSQNPYQAMPSVDYGPVVENLYHRTFCKGATELVDWAKQPFEVGIIRQLQAIGVAQPQQQNIDIINLIKREKQLVSKTKLFDPSKKLNDMKIYMVYLEWYKKLSKNDKTGYYDSYKEKKGTCEFNVEVFKKELTNYWKDMVKEAENKPQKEGASFRIRWLGAGTNYRRMVESLDIAEYYKENKLNYETQGRSHHYIRLEAWLKEWEELLKEENNSGGKQNNSKKESVASILTIDSCFWAKVEEAIILCNLLKTEKFGAEEKVKKLKDFESYVWGLLTNYEVSSEIFLTGSSFMKWWKDWKAYKKTLGSSFTSPLDDFMESREYVDYDGGNWSPPIYTRPF